MNEIIENTVNQIIEDLKEMSSSKHFDQLSRFGINTSTALGIRVPMLRAYAKKIGKSHELALGLWETNIHEARILASMIEEPDLLTIQQVDNWVNDFNSWDLCDTTCDVLGRTPFVLYLIEKYSSDNREFVKRTAFALMCELSFHNKKMQNQQFIEFFKIIEREAGDERNFVRKAVNWALRQIGKRNEFLRIKAIETAGAILVQGSKSARWIATDALRELTDERVIKRVNKQKKEKK